MSNMGRLAFTRGEQIQMAFPEKSWEESMELAMKTPMDLKNCAYVDGSFNPIIGMYGGGGIVFDQNGKPTKFTVHGRNMEYVESRNVAGEIEAVKYSFWLAFWNFGLDELTVFYDYEGIQKWADGEWNANKPLTREYAEEVNKLRGSGKKIYFEKVRAHSGDYWNGEADRLAKAACENWSAI